MIAHTLFGSIIVLSGSQISIEFKYEAKETGLKLKN